jgi:hypothetical protein
MKARMWDKFCGWTEFEFSFHGEDYHNGDKKYVFGKGKTEELAELDAIIQAIEYERSQLSL